MIEKLMKWGKNKKKCNKTSQDSRLQEDVRGKGYETRAFVRQFIHHKRVASFKLNYGERKVFFFSCQNEERAHGCDRTCKARLKDGKGRVLEMQNSPHSLVIS